MPPNVKALKARPHVALTIDTESFPPHILLVRGRASTIETVSGVAPEFLEASKMHLTAEQWAAFESEVRSLYSEQVRITITPEWAKLIDLETTLPQPIEELARNRVNRTGQR
jgi:hypothetical protein